MKLRASAIVNPHRRDCPSEFKALCGAGVALKLVAAMDGGDYDMALEEFGDLAAIGTVADIVKLESENRFIVENGLRMIKIQSVWAIGISEASGLAGKEITSFNRLYDCTRIMHQGVLVHLSRLLNCCYVRP